MASAIEEKNGAVILTRWPARILGVITAGFLSLMFIGYIVEGRNPVSDSLTPFAAIGLALMKSGGNPGTVYLFSHAACLTDQY